MSVGPGTGRKAWRSDNRVGGGPWGGTTEKETKNRESVCRKEDRGEKRWGGGVGRVPASEETGEGV